MRRKKSEEEPVRKVKRYTVGLEDDLHDWIKRIAGGTSIASAIVVILNLVRLGEIPTAERKAEDRKRK